MESCQIDIAFGSKMLKGILLEIIVVVCILVLVMLS